LKLVCANLRSCRHRHSGICVDFSITGSDLKDSVNCQLPVRPYVAAGSRSWPFVCRLGRQYWNARCRTFLFHHSRASSTSQRRLRKLIPFDGEALDHFLMRSIRSVLISRWPYARIAISSLVKCVGAARHFGTRKDRSTSGCVVTEPT
jgi:hypothetical protein